VPLDNVLALRDFPRQQIASSPGALLALALHASAHSTHVEDAVVVKIITPSDKNTLPGKLAEAELHFTEGVFDGLKLVGFTVWERRSGSGRNVTFPARSYSVNGERPSGGDATAQDRVREMILDAYAEFEEKAAIAS
jgi:hypothetical protein